MNAALRVEAKEAKAEVAAALQEPSRTEHFGSSILSSPFFRKRRPRPSSRKKSQKSSKLAPRPSWQPMAASTFDTGICWQELRSSLESTDKLKACIFLHFAACIIG